MIVITGAGGFIGSVLVGYLNKLNITDLVLIDDLPTGDQFKNLVGKQFISLHSTDEYFQDAKGVECVIHLGANSSTLEKDWNSLYRTNVLSTRIWSRFCLQNKIPFIFTSSAAVYGNGTGPLNHYAFSKQLSENEVDGVILRLFNVYGPNEYHKGRMASTLYHWYQQAQASNSIELFANSDQMIRDFVYVEDAAKIIHYFIENYKPGVYDVGTGKPASFETLADLLVKETNADKVYVEMPNDLTQQYQQYTCANLDNLIAAGFDAKQLRSIADAVPEYCRYLKTDQIY
jgi:ADP-L-glycero-D-manno-heptose 6-epimerase